MPFHIELLSSKLRVFRPSEAMALKEELTERQRYWLGHVEACERSGQTAKTYAEAHGLSTSMMYSWREGQADMGQRVKRVAFLGTARIHRANRRRFW